MIYITQGHEKSIGPEVFIKSLLALDRSSHEDFLFICFRQSIKAVLNHLKLKYEIQGKKIIIGNSILKCEFLDHQADRLSPHLTQSTLALEKGLELVSNDPNRGILVTLPTSKDQLYFKNKLQSGHTDFFRTYFGRANLSMVFLSLDLKVLLITDHVPLRKVSQAITARKIVDKVSMTINGLFKYGQPIEEAIFSGINPHCGEGGILGSEDGEVERAVQELRGIYPQVKFKGPYSGDTLYYHKKSLSQLFVYMYHDQGLAIFKALNGLIGINMTLGLPFLRMSVDHGTAFDLYGKNSANYMGSLFLLKKALEIHQN